MNEKADAIGDEHARPERAHDGQFRLEQQREPGEEHSEQQIPDQRVQDVAQFAPWEPLKKRDDFQRMSRSPGRPFADVRARSFWFGLSIHDRILQRLTRYLGHVATATVRFSAAESVPRSPGATNCSNLGPNGAAAGRATRARYRLEDRKS